MKSLWIATLAVASSAAVASADVRVKVSPTTARPGEAVLVSVTGTTELPKGAADGKPLHFFRAKSGFQALISIPLDKTLEPISVEVDSAKLPAKIVIKEKPFAETSLIVEEEMANPPANERTQIDADNKAIITAMTKSDDSEPQFTKPFRRPKGETTSPFGEWRTFNDGHRSQHLGVDVFAKEGTKVGAINAGTVTLVRDTFLAGKVVVVAHGGGIASAYFHLSGTSVTEGSTVAAGDEIGLAGHTGRTTGPHLHLAVRVAGKFVDPTTFFKLAITPAAPATAGK